MKVIGVDLEAVEPITGVDLVQGDFTSSKVQQHIQQLLPADGYCDLVLSDMSPKHSGFRDMQHFNSIRLAESALSFMRQVGRPKTSVFLCKYFGGSEEEAFFSETQKYFERLIRIKPKASRAESAEKYLLGIGLKDK